MTSTNQNDTPTSVLREEHQIILRVLGVLKRLIQRGKRGDGFETGNLNQCVEFFRQFADACHHAKEEDLLFPALESSGIPREGGPIGVMLEEHKMGRALVQKMADAMLFYKENVDDAEDVASMAVDRFYDAGQQYIELLTHHIYKEDNILFNMGDQVLSPDTQKSLCSQFCDVGCRSFGGKKKAQLEIMADELESAWPA